MTNSSKETRGSGEITETRWRPRYEDIVTQYQGPRISETEILEQVDMGLCTHKYSHIVTV